MNFIVSFDEKLHEEKVNEKGKSRVGLEIRLGACIIASLVSHGKRSPSAWFCMNVCLNLLKNPV